MEISNFKSNQYNECLCINCNFLLMCYVNSDMKSIKKTVRLNMNVFNQVRGNSVSFKIGTILKHFL